MRAVFVSCLVRFTRRIKGGKNKLNLDSLTRERERAPERTGSSLSKDDRDKSQARLVSRLPRLGKTGGTQPRLYSVGHVSATN